MQCMRIEWNMHDKLALENAEQAGPLNLCTKAHWNSFHYDCGATEKQWEGQTEKEEYNDFWLQRQEKPCIIHWNIITKNYAISLLKKSTQKRDKHLVILFTNVTVCLNAILHDMVFTRIPASVCSTPSISENSRRLLSKQMVLNILWKNSSNFNYLSLLQTKRHVDMVRIVRLTKLNTTGGKGSMNNRGWLCGIPWKLSISLKSVSVKVITKICLNNLIDNLSFYLVSWLEHLKTGACRTLKLCTNVILSMI